MSDEEEEHPPLSQTNGQVNSENEPLVFVKKSNKKSKCRLIVIILAFLLAITLLILANSLPSIISSIIHQQVSSQLPLTNNLSFTYSPWVAAPTPIYMQFWLFDVKNPAEIKKGEKPVVREIGPLTYLEKRHKEDILFNDNDTVTYREVSTFYFQPEMSTVDENYTITTVNLPVIVIGEKVRHNFEKLNFIIEFVIELFDDTLFMEKTVKEIIWGYEDPALKKIADLLKKVGIHFDPMVGLFYGKNNSDDGQYNIKNGNSHLNQFMDIYSWNGKHKLDIWTSDSANTINGTDGTMFPPFVDKDRQMYVFTSDLCRSLLLTYNSEEEVQGIPGYKFIPPDNVLANVTTNPDNQGFCIPNCLDAGVLNMSLCVPGGVPVVMSQPSFYQGAQKYIDAIDGVNPSPDGSTIIVVEPTTGVVIKAEKKIQLNMAISPVPGFPDMDNLPPLTLFPLLWVNESAVIDENSANDLKSTIVLANKLSTYANIILNIIGALLLLIVLMFFFLHCNFSQAAHSPPPPPHHHVSSSSPSS